LAGLSRRTDRNNSNIWPGFVDALAALLMVIMFLLMIFVLAQFFLSEALSGREQALDKLKVQVGELAGMLSLEKKSNAELQLNLSQIFEELLVSVALRDELKTSITLLRRNAIETSGTIKKLKNEAEFAQTRIAVLEKRSIILDQKISQISIESEAVKGSLNEAENASRILIKKIATLDNQILLLDALKKEMEGDISELARKLNENGKSLLNEKEFSASARAAVALLNQQMSALRAQLLKIKVVLEVSEAEAVKKSVQISNLGKRLNAALASKVHELSRYRSEFFGRLRDLLGKHQGVRVVGDRFVFQSEVLFAKSEAEIAAAGQAQLDQLATTLSEISLEIPDGIDWILRVDGHTDNDPISTARYPSNWELSTARAISVVKHLIKAGLPANRLVAAGFGEFHPLDKRDDEISQRRNRRIELKLTQR